VLALLAHKVLTFDTEKDLKVKCWDRTIEKYQSQNTTRFPRRFCLRVQHNVLLSAVQLDLIRNDIKTVIFVCFCIRYAALADPGAHPLPL